MSLTYEQFEAVYPTNERFNLFTNTLGGGFADLVSDEENYGNTCAMRISVAMNALGGNYKVSSQYGNRDGNHKDKSSNHIIIRVETIFDFITEKLGESTWGMSKNPGSPMDMSFVNGKKGILLYHVDFNDATGHVDLWNGSSCEYQCKTEHMTLAKMVRFWEFPLNL